MVSKILNWLFPNKPIWFDGYPPSSLPRSYIIEGMRLDSKDGMKVIPCWKYSSDYYASLL